MKENNDRKRKNRRFFEMIKKKLSKKMRKYVESCSTFMMFYADVTLEKRKLMNANSCKNRFCPFCSYRKARKEGLKISILMKKLDLDQNYEFLFLTLTAPNVPGERLREELDDYAKAFKRFSETKAFEKINVGYIRKLEITYNENRNDYHPHYHLLICVKKNYFFFLVISIFCE